MPVVLKPVDDPHPGGFVQACDGVPRKRLLASLPRIMQRFDSH
jgi:hypothetical protein